ncbi:MAG TPA: Dabb family protein [Sedimentisphaerales bacterium]|nr:Dabb family protein [Sedimentisphaerales bacterium]
MRNCAFFIAAAVAVSISGCTNVLVVNRQKPHHLIHDVYFTLNDDSETARLKLVDDCYKYLSDHPGIVFFAAGQIVETHQRDVNVRDWQVSLHIVFKTKDYHDQYQKAPNHYKFIEENEDNWKSVRVFDSFIK